MTAYDPRRPEVVADPYPALGRLREEEPVHWSEVLGGWVLTRYADVRAALADPRLSADRITPFLARRTLTASDAVQALLRQVGLWVVFTDPPTHTRLRSVLGRVLTTRAIELRRPRVEAIVRGLLDRAAAAGEMDLIRDFAYPLPVTVIGDLLGVPSGDHEQLKAWSDELATFVGSSLTAPDKYERAARGVAEMHEYFARVVARRRAAPADDLVTALLAAEERGDGLREGELVASCVLLLFAGHETTTNLIGNGALALLRHPAEARAWREDPALTAPAVEELLRYDGPTPAMVRVAREDLQADDRTIRRGDRLFLMISAANRDPRQFAEPDRLDLRRADNRHLTFGHGIHFCLGAPLARLEGQVALPALLSRFPALALRTDAPEWLDSLIFRGMQSLPVAL
ncbi:MAG TPA: cytochrome P450 [Methylomirabilota bacterium]|nr:cytochrome P450 [Methylomirabilota bacterium]